MAPFFREISQRNCPQFWIYDFMVEFLFNITLLCNHFQLYHFLSNMFRLQADIFKLVWTSLNQSTKNKNKTQKRLNVKLSQVIQKKTSVVRFFFTCNWSILLLPKDLTTVPLEKSLLLKRKMRLLSHHQINSFYVKHIDLTFNLKS